MVAAAVGAIASAAALTAFAVVLTSEYLAWREQQR